MKTAFATLGFLLLACICPLAVAQQDADTPPAAKNAKAELPPVPKALKKMGSFNAKINTEAKYYIYLQSASWCPPCRAEMPKIVAKYEAMKEDDVELVLISRDYDKKDAKGYAKEFDMPFPIHFTKKLDKIKLPGFTPSSAVPHATIVDAKGQILKDGHGNLVTAYKTIIRQHENPEDLSEDQEKKAPGEQEKRMDEEE